MKKLMIAAAAAAMVGGVYATDCIGCGAGKVIVIQPQSPTYIGIAEDECVAGHVWDLSIKAKTLGTKCISCSKICPDCYESDKVNYLDNKSRTFTGVAWTCYCPCVDEDYTGDDVQEKTDMLFWDAKNKVGFGYLNFTYTQIPTPIGGNAEYTYYTADWTLDGVTVAGSAFVNEGDAFRYGKKADKAAWGFSYEGAWINRVGLRNEGSIREQRLFVEAVGLGTIKNYKAKGNDAAYIVINKITGACVGAVTACPCPADDDVEYTGRIIPVCYDFDNWCDDGDLLDDVPFYGTFTAKYNASKSQKLRTTPAYLQQLVPAYCVIIDGEAQQ